MSLSLGLGLGLSRQGGGGAVPGWVPSGALSAINYAGSGIQRYRAARSFSRASTAIYRDASAVLQVAAVDELRINYDASGNRLGALLKTALINKIQCAKSNPVDLTHIAIAEGDASATLTVVDDSEELEAAGLLGVCSNGLVYKLDNSAGSIDTRAPAVGPTGNTNQHALSCYIRVTGSATARCQLAGNNNDNKVSAGSGYALNTQVTTPSDTTRYWQIIVNGGACAYFILPGLYETSAVPLFPIGGSATSAATRAADVETIKPTDQAVSMDWYARDIDGNDTQIAAGNVGDLEVDPSLLTAEIAIAYGVEAA